MHYILTEEEMKELRDAAAKVKIKNEIVLQDFCTRVANELPVDWGWTKGDPKKPWGCILTTRGEWYCDSCPCAEVCPHPCKHWSK